MDPFIARANIDHFLDVLKSGDLAPERYACVVRLLIAEEGKLSHGLEQLQFAEDRTEQSGHRINHLKKMRDGFAKDSTDRDIADRVLKNCEATHQLMEQFCRYMRQKVNFRPI